VLHAPPNLSSLILSPKQYLVKHTGYKAHYSVFSNLRHSLLLRSKYSPQHPVLKHFQSRFFP